MASDSAAEGASRASEQESRIQHAKRALTFAVVPLSLGLKLHSTISALAAASRFTARLASVRAACSYNDWCRFALDAPGGLSLSDVWKLAA